MNEDDLNDSTVPEHTVIASRSRLLRLTLILVMDGLPVEILIHTLHFIPIKQVFVCMSLSKKWETVCRHAIKERSCVCVGADAVGAEVCPGMDTIADVEPGLRHGMWKSLLQVISPLPLNPIFIDTIFPCAADEEVGDPGGRG